MLRNIELANPLISRPSRNRPLLVYDHNLPHPFADSQILKHFLSLTYTLRN